MADGYDYITASGVIVPDTSDLQTQVESEFKAALGNDLDTDPSTPQGALIVAEVSARAAVLANNAAVANQINPAQSGGLFLAGLCKLTGFDPPIATYTEVTGVTLTGANGAIIPLGSQAKTAAGDIFQLTGSVTLVGGTAVGNFQALEPGPVPCAAHALTSIVTAVLGWETVNNATAGVVGQAALTDAELRTLRTNTIGLQSDGLPDSMISALYDTPGVTSLRFLENTAGTVQTISGIVMAAHSIWACVAGGTDAAVAAAILASKSMGAGMNGGTTVNVTDPSSMQVYPVKFDRPTPQRIWIRATIRNGSITGDAATIVTNDLLAYAAGQVSGFDGFIVGADVSPFELAMSIGAQTPGAYVVKMEVSTDGATYVTTDVPLAINQQGTLAAADVTVLFV